MEAPARLRLFITAPRSAGVTAGQCCCATIVAKNECRTGAGEKEVYTYSPSSFISCSISNLLARFFCDAGAVEVAVSERLIGYSRGAPTSLDVKRVDATYNFPPLHLRLPTASNFHNRPRAYLILASIRFPRSYQDLFLFCSSSRCCLLPASQPFQAT